MINRRSLLASSIPALFAGRALAQSGVPGCGTMVPATTLGGAGVPNGCGPMIPNNIGDATLTPYVGLASTGGLMDLAQAASGNNQIMSKCRHIAQDDLHDLQLVFTAWYVGPGASYVESNMGSSITQTASVEFPDLSIQQVTFPSGGAIADGGTLSSNKITLNKVIPKGSAYFTYNWASFSGTILVSTVIDNANGEGSNAGVTTTDLTLTGMPGNGNFYIRRPAAVLSTTRRPTFGVIGDSRSVGIGVVGTFSNKGWQGEILPWLSDKYGWAAAQRQGAAAGDYAAFGVKSVPILANASHILCQMGINDTDFQVLSTVQASYSSIKTMFSGKKLILSTNGPHTTSTDSWATPTPGNPVPNNQTVANAGRNTTRTQANDLKRSKTMSNDGYVEIADLQENARNGGFWIGGSPALTADGLHGGYSQVYAGNPQIIGI